MVLFSRFMSIYAYLTKHVFQFFYVNLFIHKLILVDNVDNFVHNLILSHFSDFGPVDNFLDSFSLIHLLSTGFVQFARRGIFLFFTLSAKKSEA